MSLADRILKCLWPVLMLAIALDRAAMAAEPPPEPPAGWFTVAPRPYPGLLGKRYVAGNYVYLAHDDEFLDLFDSSFEGFGVGFNHPILQPTPDYWLGIDGFVTWGSLNLGGAHQFPPPAPVGVQLDVDSSTTSFGATFYADPLQPVRPLVQIGASFSRYSSLLLVDGFGGTAVDHDTDFLFAAGIEFDITDWLAARTVFDLDTEGSLGDSSFRGDLIAWPAERVFLRGGLLVPLDGDGTGGHVGVGVTF